MEADRTGESHCNMIKSPIRRCDLSCQNHHRAFVLSLCGRPEVRLRIILTSILKSPALSSSSVVSPECADPLLSLYPFCSRNGEELFRELFSSLVTGDVERIYRETIFIIVVRLKRRRGRWGVTSKRQLELPERSESDLIKLKIYSRLLWSEICACARKFR